MADPLALVSVLAGAVSFSGAALLSSSLTLRDAVDLLRARWAAKAKQLDPYGLPRFLRPLLLPLTDTLSTMTHNIVQASDARARDYCARRMTACSMTSVAAALVAQLANTSTQHEFTSQLHWSVTALWTCAMVLALMSVYSSFLLHYWLAGLPGRAAFMHRGAAAQGVPSLTVAARLWVPTWLLNVAIGCYVLTLGLYWGLAWSAGAAGRGVGSRNVFVCYVVAVVGAVAAFTVPTAVGTMLRDVDGLYLYRAEMKGVSEPAGEGARGQEIGGALLAAVEAHRELAEVLERLGRGRGEGGDV